MATGLYARSFGGQMTDKVITIGSCQNLKIGISAFFPRNVANLATFFPKTSFVEVAARLFLSPRREILSQKIKNAALVTVCTKVDTRPTRCLLPRIQPCTFPSETPLQSEARAS